MFHFIAYDEHLIKRVTGHHFDRTVSRLTISAIGNRYTDQADELNKLYKAKPSKIQYQDNRQWLALRRSLSFVTTRKKILHQKIISYSQKLI